MRGRRTGSAENGDGPESAFCMTLCTFAPLPIFSLIFANSSSLDVLLNSSPPPRVTGPGAPNRISRVRRVVVFK